MYPETKIAEFLQTALAKGGDWADLFLEETIKNQASLSDKKVQTVSQQQMAGAGIRVVANRREYYAYTNDLSETGLIKAAKAVADALSLSQADRAIPLEEKIQMAHTIPLKKPEEISWENKIILLKEADDYCRKVSDKISQVGVNYLDEVQRIWVANSDGMNKEDCRFRCRFAVTAVAADGNEKQIAHEAPGAHKGFEFFESLDVKSLCQDAAARAVSMLTAPYAPQGRMTVIIDGGFGGVIFHEACGHSLEASAVAKKSTVFANSMGQLIASPCVSAVDDGTLSLEWGSTAIDDEGTPTQKNLLIDKGILKSFLVDRLNGERIGQKPTGSSRRQSYRFAPTSRMNNTFILPGIDSLDEMIASTDYGLYAKKLGGGSVNPATGEFNFAVTEGYLIKNGKIISPVRGAVLIGRGDEILKKIDRVGANLELAQGMCGAASGWIPVDVGQPAIRVQDLLVGGQ